MPRKTSQGPAKAIVRIDVLVNNMCTRAEMEHTLIKDLADPFSLISRYLKEKFNWEPRGEDYGTRFHDVAIRSVSAQTWIHRWKRATDPAYNALHLKEDVDDDGDDDDDDDDVPDIDLVLQK